MTKSILLLNGPNLNLLGTREPHLYDATSLTQVLTSTAQQRAAKNMRLKILQYNHEGALIDRIHPVRGIIDFIVVNPAGLTHTSVALRDALLSVGIPFVQVPVRNVHSRKGFRGKSYLSDRAMAVVCGMGVYGYEVAIEYAARYLGPKANLWCWN